MNIETRSGSAVTDAVFTALLQAQQDGRDVVLATVIATRGSVPRHAGSKMIIDTATGALIGTIGGGCGEGDVIAASHDVANTGQPRTIRIELTDSIDSFSPAVCGGVLDVFIELVRASKENA